MMRSPAAQSKITEPVPFRQAPHNIEAEQALLGAVLINNDSFDRVSDLIEEKHFFDPVHARIFAAMREMSRLGTKITPITLRPFFEHEDPIAEPNPAKGVTGLSVPQYLGRLAASATSIINAKDYAQTIVDLATRRELISIGEDVVNLAYDSPVDANPAVQIEQAEAELFRLGKHGAASAHDFTMQQATSSAIDMIANAYGRGNRLAGIPTGFADLDRHVGGLCDSDLIILAGRPSMGKSALAAQIGFNVAKWLAEQRAAGEMRLDLVDGRPPDPGGEVLFFSLEMSAEQLTMRQIAVETGISAEAMRVGGVSEAEFGRIMDAGKALAALPLHIDTTGAISVAQLTARARRRKRLHRTRLVIIDYLQLMVSGDRAENRVVEITKITTGLKAMAKELGVPVLALSQLSRKVEEREDKRPQLSDLRESGSIEQDADIVLFVYREAYYLKRSEPPQTKIEKYNEWKAAMNEADGLAEVIRGKHRHGSVGTSTLHFEDKTTKFSNLARAEYDLSGAV